MGNKALKIFYAAFMALMVVALAVFMVIHIQAGLEDTNAKIFLAGYVLLIIWAVGRLISLIRNLRG
jgi:membrane-anchored glycerophosphoryl diester phosphodiesterase (GDPDase)